MATSRQSMSNKLAAGFERDGFAFPVDVMGAEQAQQYRRELEALEDIAAGNKLGNNDQLNYPHVIFSFAYEIICNLQILDAVESILGPDILCWGSTFFIKEPHSESYVSWHQDLRYWGLDSDDEVSAWLALSTVTEANGCMRFVPGSHKCGLIPHSDSFGAL